MGDRAQVCIEDTNVYLYTHHEGYLLESLVKAVLMKRERWNDPEYLARIVFSKMIEHDIHGDTGYGISTSEHGDLQHPLIVLNCKYRMITIGRNSESFEDFIMR